MEQAEPLEALIPISSNFNKIDVPSTPSNEKFAFPGNLSSIAPFNITFGILLFTSCI